jgi:hypothetical protein
MIKVVVGLVALGAAAAVGVAVWTGGVQGPDSRTITPLPVVSPQDSFVVHDAAPAAPAPAAPPATPDPAAQSSDLDAVMQRMRAAQPAKPDTLTVTAPPASPGAAGSPAAAPAAAPDATLAGPNPAPSALAGPTPDASALAGPPPPSLPPEPARWPNMTTQGARWRLGRDGGGPMLVIDMGAGRVAQVRVLPAFQALDQAGMNSRIDYIKQTILENFPPGSVSFMFARDGSVTLLH